MRLLKTASVFVTCSLLAGCATQKTTDSAVCPDAKVVGELSTKTWHNEAGVETSRFELDGVRVACRKNNTQEDKNSVHLDFKMQVSLMRDNPYQDDTITSAPFIAIVDPKGNVVLKNVMPINISLEKGQKRTSIVHTFDEDLHLPAGETLAQYQALVGYDLTKNEQAEQKSARNKTIHKVNKKRAKSV